MIRANCAMLKGVVHERGGVTRAEVEEIEHQTKEYADSARQSADIASSKLEETRVYSTTAASSAESASASATAANNAAVLAQQGAENNGFIMFQIVEGRLIETKSENAQVPTFSLNEGRLVATYE